MRWKLALGIALSALFLWLAFRQVSLRAVLETLAAAQYLWMLPALVLTVLAFALRAWRWRYLLASVRTVPMGPLFSATMIGFMGNNILPARLGELLRAHSLGRRTGVSRSTALASIVVERILDIFVLLFIFAAILIFRGLPPLIRSWGAVLLLLALPILGLLVVYEARSEAMLRLIERAIPGRFRERTLEIARNFREGLVILRRGRTLLSALFFSLAMWACLTLVVMICFVALDLKLPVGAGLTALVIMAIGTMIPSAPGFIGTLQYAGKLALLQYGVEEPLALSFTIVYHASQWIPVTSIGLFYFMREQLSLDAVPGISGGPKTDEGS